MKFLIVGLGSMGKRRIRNLLYLGEKDIIGFDFREDRRKEANEKYGVDVYDNIDDAMKQRPDTFIISTPPNHHLEYELLAAKNNKPFFCEAGIFTKGQEELSKLVKEKGVIAFPSCTMRFNMSILKLKELVESNKIGKIVSLTYHLGQYLPDWHPWEGIIDFYVGHQETSATREMIPFELMWLTWIFGDVSKISCFKGKLSSLEADIDDVYQLMLEFKQGIIGNYLVEVVSRTPTRLLRVIGEEGTIEWDWMADTLKIYQASTKKWIEFKEDKGFKEEGYVTKENMYIDEIKSFLDSIRKNEQPSYTLEQDHAILRILELAEDSVNQGKHIKIN